MPFKLNTKKVIRDEQYHKIAEEFQSNVGVMDWDGGPLYPFYSNVQKMPDEFKVMILTRAIIKEGIYQKVIREVIRLESKYGKKRINKSTLYEKALNNLVEQNEIHSIV